MFAYSRPVIGRVSWLILFSLYIALFLNLAFYHNVLKAMPLTSARNVMVFLSMPVVAFSVINIVVTLASFLCLDRIVVALFILMSVLAQYFIQNYGIILDRSMILNMLDTTASETFALMTPQLLATLFFAGIVVIAASFWLRHKPYPSLMSAMVYRLLNILCSGLLIIIVALLFYKDYASLFRNNRELVKSLSPSNSITAVLSYYQHHRLQNLPLIKIGEDARLDHAVAGNTKKRLTILIVGETSRGANFSLGGYGRQTNPRLAQDNVIYFPHTQSCGTSTAVSVPCMFSNMPRAHYDDVRAGHQEGLSDILQRAGIEVLWRENDGGCKGACDRVPHQDMSSLNLPGMCIKGECYDEVLFNKIEEYISHLNGDGVIILHTIGSHGPTYYNRYPPAFRKFTPTCDTNEIQTCSNAQLVNTYDNTLLYVDYIVDKAIAVLNEHQDRFTGSLIYLSDHGESLGENGTYLHGMPYAIAPDVQTHVPMLIWLSDDYQKRFAVTRDCLQKRATQPYSQDNLFSTMLGMTGTVTREYRASDDILSACRVK